MDNNSNLAQGVLSIYAGRGSHSSRTRRRRFMFLKKRPPDTGSIIRNLSKSDTRGRASRTSSGATTLCAGLHTLASQRSMICRSQDRESTLASLCRSLWLD